MAMQQMGSETQYGFHNNNANGNSSHNNNPGTRTGPHTDLMKGLSSSQSLQSTNGHNSNLKTALSLPRDANIGMSMIGLSASNNYNAGNGNQNASSSSNNAGGVRIIPTEKVEISGQESYTSGGMEGLTGNSNISIVNNSINFGTPERPHVCGICAASYKTRTHLRRHMYVHLNDRPYECDICSKGFNRFVI